MRGEERARENRSWSGAPEGGRKPEVAGAGAEKSLVAKNQRFPYRRPTQVDRWRTPRRAREPSLRNSANWPRNFGRSGAWRQAAAKGPYRLFNKTTGLCQTER